MKISAKELGVLDMEGFCPRCFWIKRHDRKLPYQTPFAGIFSSIDAFTKNVVERYFERTGKLPVWLESVGQVERLIPVKINEFVAEKDGVALNGMPDLLFQRPDKSYGLLDYKTARYTGTQDALMPIYEVQLNGYAYIAEAIGMKLLNDLYLVYFEPPKREAFDKESALHIRNEGFEMPFRPVVHKLRKNTRHIEELLKKAEAVYSEEKVPAGIPNCEECARLDTLLKLVYGDSIIPERKGI